MPVPVGKARQDLATLRAALVPADARTIGIALDSVIAVLGVPKRGCLDAWTSAVIEAFQDARVPADLVALAARRARTNLRFPPMPGELIDLIRDDLARRRLAELRLQSALMFARWQGAA